MRLILSFFSLLFCLMLAGFIYQQIFVEGEFGPAAIVGCAGLGLFALISGLMAYFSGTRHREAVRNIILVLTVSIATYLVADFVLGRILIVPLSPPLVADDYRHHALVPDSFAELRQPDFHYIQRVNALGLRGRETSLEKPAGTRRILMLGDSFTMGKGVEDDETFSVLVEAELQRRAAGRGCGSIEVLNGGVDSYAPILSYLQLKRDLIKLSPDLVVLNFDNSDLIQEQAYRNQSVRDESGQIVAVPQIAQDSLYERFQSWVTRNFYLTRIALVHVIRAMDNTNISVRRVVNEFGREHFAHTLAGDVDRSGQWSDVFESLGRIKNLAEANAAQFLLSTYPWAHQVNDIDWVPGRFAYMEEGESTSDVTRDTMRKNSETLGIALHESLPVFQQYAAGEPLYFKLDPHWTPAGHRVMAKGLSAYIAENYLARWCEG